MEILHSSPRTMYATGRLLVPWLARNFFAAFSACSASLLDFSSSSCSLLVRFLSSRAFFLRAIASLSARSALPRCARASASTHPPFHLCGPHLPSVAHCSIPLSPISSIPRSKVDPPPHLLYIRRYPMRIQHGRFTDSPSSHQ